MQLRLCLRPKAGLANRRVFFIEENGFGNKDNGFLVGKRWIVVICLVYVEGANKIEGCDCGET